tara:strand:+ start:333 stop:509 length:177 start_codon:yes stop_codon:yes gene_type:complete
MFDAQTPCPHEIIRQLFGAGKTVDEIAEYFTSGTVVDSLVFVGQKAIRIGLTVYELPA